MKAVSRDPRYDILFEPVRLGPVTAPNRFYQVPHCNGMGHQYPSSMAEMRSVKAEGGWGVVNTEEVEIHHTSELSGVIESRLWDDSDIPVLARMVERVHEHGALAGIEPAHLGMGAANNYSREIPMGPTARPIDLLEPVQSRAMDKADIRAFREMHVNAALRSRRAGFDIVYVYAGHDMTTLMHFLSPTRNDRTDEYGGSLENRVRLMREVLEDTKEAIGDTCAVAVRLAVDEMQGAEGISADEEGRAIVEILADLPDLWDVNVSGWENDSATSRFSQEGYQTDYISWVKDVTSKPVVGVGRFTSPDTMVSLVRNGVLDFVGAARPSIADPFLPRKIEEGRPEDIRECIGCNICVTADFLVHPMRCTQNPTMGEEWRKGWHPERIAPKSADESVLIVGAGPAGLEAARALGQRGYDVTLAEAGRAVGGRVAVESRLPGLSAWKRVADYREYQISQMANVALYLESPLSADEVLDFGADHVAFATGSVWAGSGVGRTNRLPITADDGARIMTPDDICGGKVPQGPVVVFDDDYYYMAGLMAEKLRDDGHDVTYVTPAADVSHWTHNTMEQERIQTRLMEMGVRIVPLHNLARLGADSADLSCVYTDRVQTVPCGTAVLVTMRAATDSLFHEVAALSDDRPDAKPATLLRIGDCLAPGTIAAAVYGGHRFARELGEPATDGVPFRRELPALAQDRRSG
ncbi:NADH:flavin oxidoreductase [Roseovarius sp. TE539]|uniref:oxidoreductase n=1 Tax=Roseovarius sp. TE539 TaxID=2249812 RepID=UPI000DE0A498|nr:FAD-dependent oxidoreductase [Roseovarius sp. TE539]RBI70333.1 NADH:flavin oxidoreductase [Roseovarius sp. TE539]